MQEKLSYAYNNQKRLDVECKKLENKSCNLIKYAEQWVDLVEQMNQTLKEIGDVENWSKVMERDVVAITNILEQTKNKN
uniref:Biogenesis of lysosome-related organelles complex 1 subunit 1 n=1 Tax=Meloidogyne javanica TaxID=6303 RepID=A0A915N0K0_MELJA